jgi:hypothetical protein
VDSGEHGIWMEEKARSMSWFPTMDLRWIERIGNGPGYRVKVLQQRWEKRWGQDIGGEEWRDIPIADPGLALAEHYAGMRLPESEGQSSEAITYTETSECPARQSGSPEVDPSGERQVCGMDLGNGIKCSGPKDHPPGLHQYEVDFL